MLGKLLKHDMVYLIRTYGLFYAIFLIVSLVIGVVLLVFDSKERSQFDLVLIYVMMITSPILSVGSFILMIMPFIDSLKRFNSNMLSDEGYLTNTLPASSNTLLASKLISAVISIGISSIVVLAGSALTDISGNGPMKWFIESIKNGTLDIPQSLCIIALFLCIYLFLVNMGYMVSCISAMTNAGTAGGGLLTIGIVVADILAAIRIGIWLGSDLQVGSETSVLIQAGFQLICAAGMYLITLYMLKHHLNLP